MTLLDAVNVVLRSLGEGRVLSLDVTHPSVDFALSIVNEQVQLKLSKGYWFNTDYNYTITPNTSGELKVPVDTIDLAVKYPYGYLRKRGDKLYDPYENTYNIGIKVDATIIFDVGFEDMPVVAQTATAYRAAAKAVSDDDGDQTKYDRLDKEAMEAELSLEAENIKRMRYNALSSPTSLRIRSGIHGANGSVLSGDYIGGRPR